MIEQRHITSSRPTGLTSDLPVERLLRDALETSNSRFTDFARESVIHKVDFNETGRAPISRRVGNQWEFLGDLLAVAFGDSDGDTRVLSVLPSPSGGALLVRASRLGADHAMTHEVIVNGASLEKGYFQAAASKGGLQWQDEDTVLAFVAADESELTRAGHPRVVRLWRRGESLSEATVIAEVPQDAVTVMAEHLGNDAYLITEQTTSGRRWHLRSSRETRTLDLPHGSQVWAGHNGVYASPAAGSHTAFKAQSLVFFPAEEPSRPEAVLERAVVVSAAPFEDGIAVVVVRDGQEWLMHARRTDRSWTIDDLGHWGGACTIIRADWDQVVTSLSSPATLPYTVTCRAAEPIRDAAPRLEYRALGEAAYHLCRTSSAPAPTLVCVYGGFGVSVRPEYRPEMYAGWVAHGFNLVLAHVRGGGEKGVAWALAGQKTGKLQAADDLASILQDLTDSGISDPAHLACLGSSNGGLLTALTCIRHPDLLRTAVLNNALLDLSVMESTSAGRGWLEEYGSWSKESRDMHAYSPIHQLPNDCSSLPELLVCSQRNDDRIPFHRARAFVNTLTGRGGQATLLEGRGSHRGPTDQAAGIDLLATIFRFLHSTIT